MGSNDASASASAIFLCTLDSFSAKSLCLVLEALPWERYVHASSEHPRAVVSDGATPPPPATTTLIRSYIIFFPR